MTSNFIRSLLLEARDPSLTYTPKKVGKTIKGVILSLEKQQASAFTKLTRAYVKLESAIEILEERRNSLNKQMKEDFEGLFDPEDALLTRIVETAGVTVQLSARSEAKEKVTDKTDYKAIVNALLELVDGDLLAKAEEIVNQYQVIERTIVEPKSPALTVKRDAKLNESLLDSLKTTISKQVVKIKREFERWSKVFDKKLSKIQGQIESL